MLVVLVSTLGANLLLGWIVWLVVAKKAYGSYPLFLAYLFVLIITTTGDLAIYLKSEQWTQSGFREIYWANESVRQFVRYLLVLSLIDLAAGAGRRRGIVRRWLALLTVLIAAVSWFFYPRDNPDLWMTILFRNLSFTAAILTLILWALLLRVETRPRSLLLLITAGLGIQMAGDAVGQSLRQMGRTTVVLGDVLVVGSYLLGLVIWLLAFRSLPRRS